MSGGSYNYLYCEAGDVSGLGKHIHDLKEMVERLEGIDGESHAACDSREVMSFLRAAERWSARLADVWHAVEWRDSHDWSTDQMMEVIQEYNNQRATEEAKDVDALEGPLLVYVYKRGTEEEMHIHPSDIERVYPYRVRSENAETP